MAQFTKGKWKYTRPQIGTSSGIICTMIEPHFMPDCGDVTWYNGCVETMNANAHLISSAPEMYEALKAILPWAKDWIKFLRQNVGEGQGQDANDQLLKAVKALAKAEREGG